MAFLLYLDEDLLERRLVRGLRAAGIDVVTASDAETAGWLDADQLVFARSLGRVILTANVKDSRLCTVDGWPPGSITPGFSC